MLAGRLPDAAEAPRPVAIKSHGLDTPSREPSPSPRALRSQGFVYEGALRAGQYDPKLSVVLEDVGGQWKVSQWL